MIISLSPYLITFIFTSSSPHIFTSSSLEYPLNVSLLHLHFIFTSYLEKSCLWQQRQALLPLTTPPHIFTAASAASSAAASALLLPLLYYYLATSLQVSPASSVPSLLQTVALPPLLPLYPCTAPTTPYDTPPIPTPLLLSTAAPSLPP